MSKSGNGNDGMGGPKAPEHQIQTQGPRITTGPNTMGGNVQQNIAGSKK